MGAKGSMINWHGWDWRVEPSRGGAFGSYLEEQVQARLKFWTQVVVGVERIGEGSCPLVSRYDPVISILAQV